MMSTFVESLKRLYNQGKVSKEKLDGYLLSDKLTQEEYEYVIAE